jgi:hypothetical protein
MPNIILGFILILFGLLNIVWGISSEIPKPNKGYHFVYAKDGYEIYRLKLNNSYYEGSKKEEVHVLTMEKIEGKQENGN